MYTYEDESFTNYRSMAEERAAIPPIDSSGFLMNRTRILPRNNPLPLPTSFSKTKPGPSSPPTIARTLVLKPASIPTVAANTDASIAMLVPITSTSVFPPASISKPRFSSRKTPRCYFARCYHHPDGNLRSWESAASPTATNLWSGA